MRSGILGINHDASKAHFLRRILRQKQLSDGCYPRNNRRKITNFQWNISNITKFFLHNFDLSHAYTSMQTTKHPANPHKIHLYLIYNHIRYIKHHIFFYTIYIPEFHLHVRSGDAQSYFRK